MVQLQFGISCIVALKNTLLGPAPLHDQKKFAQPRRQCNLAIQFIITLGDEGFWHVQQGPQLA